MNEEEKEIAEEKFAKSEFWKSEPVPAFSEDISEDAIGPIDKLKKVDDIQPEPYTIHPKFEWDETNVDDPKVLQEIYDLLTQNYVEDDDSMFRFDYSKEFLLWALKPPHYRKDWHVGIRVKTSKKLVGFITAIPALIKVRGQNVKMVEINFLCVHKKLRDKKFAPLLIKEITRRVNRTDVWQAVYTAGVVLPKPFGKCRYWHRSLNPRKLLAVGFSHLSRTMTVSRAQRLFRVPDQTKTPGIRVMLQKDVPQVTKLLRKRLDTCYLTPVFDEDEAAHWLLTRKDVINSYVVEDPKTKKITDLTSFYTLPSTILRHKKYNKLNAAYFFYNVAGATSMRDLITDTLVLAKKAGYDVFNCLDLAAKEELLSELKFGRGDGNLQYYLYNYRCPALAPEQIGLVLM
eukprot:TRINITY_DN6696_c0_g1_i1.p1 TRINITY_DN6696_c0_g1~~TRINITY_DN6696_c0_g1_i1.p1  ORF type:complete len:401 (-),score=57.73 TRINITY_DN6696_c0_g1_i1:422-1624(-)